jgi:hypothetical protein
MQKAMHGYLNCESYKVFLREDLFPNRHYAPFVHTVVIRPPSVLIPYLTKPFLSTPNDSS